MKYSRAFTLMELAIVLVVIGLIAGSIVGGQVLIRSSELRSVTSDVNKFKTALGAFQERYRYLPGDIPNATKIWGAAHVNPTTCKSTTGTGTLTCNGDGDGLITVLGTGSTYYELARAWQHLAIAELIEGNYTGRIGPGGGWHIVPGVNAPKSKIDGGSYGMYSCEGCGITYSVGEFFAAANDKLMMDFGKERNGDTPIRPILTPEEAWSIDLKADDGRPGLGSIMTLKPVWEPNCNTSSNASVSEYNVTHKNVACHLGFVMQ